MDFLITGFILFIFGNKTTNSPLKIQKEPAL